MACKSLSAAELLANRSVVLAAYRYLLRATRLAFQDDAPTLTASRAHARAAFTHSRALEPGSVDAAQALEHAQGVAQILRENVVQGKRVGSEQEERYKLRMHEHTQRMDNETAGALKGTTKSFREIRGERF